MNTRALLELMEMNVDILARVKTAESVLMKLELVSVRLAGQGPIVKKFVQMDSMV